MEENMKKYLLLSIGLFSLPSFSEVSANVGFTTDYIWRGMTQSDGPAVSGGFDYASESGFYAGFWGSNVNFGDGNGQELDYYAGYAFDVSDSVSMDIGYLVFDYPDASPDIKFEEIYLGLSFGDLGILYASGQDDATDYLELSYGIGPVSFAYGTYDDMGDNYSISYGFACGSYECGLTLYDFTDEGYSGVDEDGVFFSIAASL